MQPVTLEPVARIPLRVSRDGSATMPTVEFAGSTIAISQSTDRNSPLDLALWIVPDIGLLLLILVPLFLARHFHRVLTRPQIPGRPHCRKCNYELSSPPSQREGLGVGFNLSHVTPATPPHPSLPSPPPSSCPECSHPTTRPLLGRTNIERLAAPTLISLLVVAVCIGALGLLLQKPPWPGVRLWPAPIVSDIFPSLAASKNTDHESKVTLVSRWQLPADNQPLRHIPRDARLAEDLTYSCSMSPDTRWIIACVTNQTPATWNASVIIINADTGERRTIPLTVSASMVTPTLRAFSHDGSAAYIQIQVWNNLSPALTCDTILARFDLATGVRTDIVTIRSNMLIRKGTPEMPQQFFVVREQDTAPLFWVLLTQTAAYTPTSPQQAELTLAAHDGALRRIPLTFSGSSFFAPTLNEDAGTFSMDLFGTTAPTTLTVDLATGTATESPCTHTPGAILSHAGGLVIPPFVPGTPPATPITVNDETTGQPAAQLSGHQSVAYAQLSPDGRWAWTTDITGPPSTPFWRCSPLNHTRATLLVWDLSSVRAPLPPGGATAPPPSLP